MILVPPGSGLYGMSAVASAAPSADAASMQVSEPAAGHPLHAVEMSSPGHAMMAAHDHDAAECDEYCMNCSSHCYTTAIVSSGSSSPHSASLSTGLESGDTADRAYLLFRPPIRA